ncbi:gp53-like domain-containing protein [Pseudomonas bananamidigenes]|uniref:gp53-like domain-containing protein n=1 Tax=Pseudomonas bananamidigenes TaxID=2843610 RepID=UPI000A6DBBDB|nr:hypothetical protein [Pseudomonas bananamidigenes]
MDYPKSVPSVGLVDGKFVDENPLTGTPGSLIPSAWGNSVTDEVLNVIQAAGLAPAEADLTQLLQAIRVIGQLGSGGYGADTGVANAYLVAYTPAVVAVDEKLVLRFKAKTANTGASTFAPNGLAPGPLLGPSHLPLQGGEIVANGLCTVRYSVALAAWILVSSSGGGLQVSNGTKSHHAVALGQTATESAAGVTQFASPAEILAGAISDKAVSPLGLLVTFIGAGGAANNDYIKIPFRDKSSGVRRELIIQWIRTTTLGSQGAPSNFPIAFPNACCGVWASSANGASPTTIAAGNPTTTTFLSWAGTIPCAFGAIAIGY